MPKTRHVAAAMALAALTVAARAEVPPETAWVRFWNGPANHEDIGRLVAIDTPDRIYVGGTSYTPGSGGTAHDYVLLQYDSNGNLAWSRRYGGSGSETVSDLVVPAAGEVIITGFSPSLGGIDIATVKYDHLGNLLRDRRRAVSGISVDLGPKLAIDHDGNILVSATNAGDYLLLKYSPTGDLLWFRSYDGTAHGDDIATDVALDSFGNAYVTGTVNSAHAFGTVKFSSAGDFLWAQIEPGDIGSVFTPSQVAVGPDDNPVVAGNPESTCGVFQFKIWKCNAVSGIVLWSDKAPSQPCNSLIFADLVLDGSGAALAACSGSVDGGESHMQVLRYSADGLRQWIRPYDGPGTAEDNAAAIATDAFGSAYVFGYTDFPPQNRDYAAAKISADGQLQWDFTWASSQGTNDLGQDVGVDTAGGVILTGNSYNPTQNEDVVTIKLQQTTPASADLVRRAEESSLWVSPNPVAGSARISFVLPHDGWTRLHVLDAQGRMLRRLYEGVSPSGRHEVSWSPADARGARVPAGVYFVRLEAAGAARRVRMVVLP